MLDRRLELIFNSLPALLRGTVITIQLTVLILIFGLILGLILAFGETYGNILIRKFTALIWQSSQKYTRTCTFIISFLWPSQSRF